MDKKKERYCAFNNNRVDVSGLNFFFSWFVLFKRKNKCHLGSLLEKILDNKRIFF